MNMRPSTGEQGFTLVELLVTIVIMGIVASGITSVVVSTLGTEQYQRQLQDVVDDGRVSLQRIRQELRGARRVLDSSAPDRLHFWVDQNQDSLVAPEEQICYVVEAISATQWQISRWAHAEDAADCAPGAIPAGQTPRVVASTLISSNPSDPTETPAPFVYSPVPGGVNSPPTREVTIDLDLEVESARGPESVQVQGSIRLRNVP